MVAVDISKRGQHPRLLHCSQVGPRSRPDSSNPSACFNSAKMEARSYEGPMDWEYQDKGPLDPTSPFAQAAKNIQRNSKSSCLHSSVCLAYQYPGDGHNYQRYISNTAAQILDHHSKRPDPRIPLRIFSRRQNLSPTPLKLLDLRPSYPQETPLRHSEIPPLRLLENPSMRLSFLKHLVRRTAQLAQRFQTIQTTLQK